MLDNLRRTLSAPACHARLAGRLGVAARTRRSSGPASSSRRSRCPPSFPSSAPSCRAAPGSRCAAISRALGADLRLALDPVGAPGHLPGASGVADGRCDRAHPDAGCSSPAGICSNGFRRRRRRSVPGSTSSASIAGWPARSSSAFWRVVVAAGFAGHGTWPLAVPFARSGSPRPQSRAGPACLPASPAGCRYRPPTLAPCG